MIDQKRLPIMSGLKPFSKFLFTAVMVFSVGLIFQLAASLLASLAFNCQVKELFESTGSGEIINVSAMKFIQIVGGIGTFIVSGFILSYLYTGSWHSIFLFNIRPEVRATLIIVMIMLSALPAVNFLTEVNMKMEIPFESLELVLKELQDKTETMTMAMLRADNIGVLLINLFMIAVIPAVGEEMIFRGLLQKHLTEMFKNVHFAIILAAAIFSIVHMQVYAFLPRFFLGLILGYLFYYGKSIWYPIIAHLINNGMGVLFYYYQSKQEGGEALEEIGTQTMMPVISLLSLIIVGLLMYVWIRVVQSNLSLQPDRGEIN